MWQMVKLGDICSVITKGTTPTSVGFKFQDEGINFVKIESIDESGNFLKSKFAKIGEDCYASLKRSQLAEGDILFSIAGALGRTAVVTPDILPANTNQALAIFRIKPELEIDRRYMLYVLNSETTKSQSEANKGGVAQLNLSLSQLKDYSILLPPLAEQQRIVAKLDAAFLEIDKAIELVEEQVATAVKLETQSLASLFQSQGSSIKRLAEVAQIKGGKRLPKGNKLTTDNTGFPYIRVSDFNDDGSIDKDSVQFVEAEVQRQISRYTISSADVYVSIAGTIGKTGVVPPSLDNANLTENAAKLVLNKDVDRDYVYYFTRTTSFDMQAIAQTRQTAQPKLALERLGAVEMPIYNLQRQQQIAETARQLTEMISHVKANRREKLLNLAVLKSAILAQELQPREAA